MKREAMGNTKMKKLCRRLGIKQYIAVGILESLWHLTAREAPQGNIGKLTDEDIALALDYDDAPETLIAALKDSRWLDPSATHRLVVHDWHEHADDAVKKRLRRCRKPFFTASGELWPDMSGHVPPSAADGSLPEPEPEPGPEPEPAPEPEEKTSPGRSKAAPESRTLPPEEVAGTLPLIDGTIYQVSKAQVKEWSEAYPAVDVRQQLREMKQWLVANGVNRKTRSGIQRFIVKWLAKEQDKGGSAPARSQPSQPVAIGASDERAREMWESMPEKFKQENPWGGSVQ